VGELLLAQHFCPGSRSVMLGSRRAKWSAAGILSSRSNNIYDAEGVSTVKRRGRSSRRIMRSSAFFAMYQLRELASLCIHRCWTSRRWKIWLEHSAKAVKAEWQFTL